MSKPEKYRRSTEIMLLDTVLMEEKMLHESDIEPKIISVLKFVYRMFFDRSSTNHNFKRVWPWVISELFRGLFETILK